MPGLSLKCLKMTAGKPKKKKRKKKHNPLVDWLLYVALRIVLVFIYLFDIETNLRTARFLGRLLWKYYHRGRNRALDNLRASFPDKDTQWIEQIGRRSFEHIVMLVMDVLYTPRLVKKYNWRNYSRYKNAERVKWLMQGGDGVLMVTSHYGNFEIVGYLLGLFGFDIYSVARPLDNKYINKYLLGVREQRGQKIIDKKGAADIMGRIVSHGGTICFIADQDAGKKGLFVDFFGRKASTYKSIGLLAIQHNLPICVGLSRRIGDRFFFEIEVTRLIMPQEWADKDDPLEWVTAEYTREIEQYIRRDPSQYWWLHRRWKTRPKEERTTKETKRIVESGNRKNATIIRQAPYATKAT
jgi:KDO2-lipid IV(A) lauroyltransferase